MIFDSVHDIQQAFRVLLNTFTYPGTIGNYSKFIQKLNGNFQSIKYIFGSIFLDHEVTFFIEEASINLESLFYTKQVPIEGADFVFLKAKDLTYERLLQLKHGDYVDPHKSSLLFIEVEKLSNQADYLLSGPGIKDAHPVSLHKDNFVLDLWMNWHLEFPLGIDVVIHTIDQNIALPRTTQLKKVN